jgi:hypothetical protein
MTVNGRDYCTVCRDQIRAAVGRVNSHVQPPDCFVWYVGGSQGWQPIPGTGCAHWVAHQRNIRVASAGTNVCLEGHPIRVPTILQGKSEVALANVQVDDIWANSELSHTGLVIRVTEDRARRGMRNITIRHDSSRQGGVNDNDFATYFKGQGRFYR